MPNKKTIGIVVVNWRSGKVILDCLESIRKAGYLESVVVVDNASNDGSLEELKALSVKRKVKIIENNENLGFAEGNNRGIRYLLGNSFTPGESWLASPLPPATPGVVLPKYIFILNPDTEINKETIPKLLEVMDGDREIGICGPKILFPPPSGEPLRVTPEVSLPIIWSGGGVIDKKRYSGGLIGLGEIDNGQYDKIKEVDFISGTAMMVRREVFERCGLFNPDYFIYYEDVELNLAAKRTGFKTVFVPQSEILHKESSSMGKSSPAQKYYMARNHLLFVERNAPFSIRVRELVRLPKTVYEHWRRREIWGIRGIKDYFMRRFGKLRSPSGESWSDSSTPGESLRAAPGVS